LISAPAHAKINLALAVGPTRPDGLHEVATLLQRIDLADTVTVEPAGELTVQGFEEDTLVRSALTELAAAAGVAPCWRAWLEKRIPVAAGLAGGSSDAATALRLACELLDDPPPSGRLREIAVGLGVDVAFFLTDGPQLGTGTGTTLEPVDLPQDYTVVLLLPEGAVKPSTAEIYHRFGGEAGFEQRRAQVLAAAAAGRNADLASLPPNDLASSPFSDRLLELGAFRADVSGAGPAVYGLFERRGRAERAAVDLEAVGETWLATPAW
jgi:4-diphosphocytidyl-2-C-methyl-D-erythritol kinase